MRDYGSCLLFLRCTPRSMQSLSWRSAATTGGRELIHSNKFPVIKKKIQLYLEILPICWHIVSVIFGSSRIHHLYTKGIVRGVRRSPPMGVVPCCACRELAVNHGHSTPCPSWSSLTIKKANPSLGPGTIQTVKESHLQTDSVLIT